MQPNQNIHIADVFEAVVDKVPDFKALTLGDSTWSYRDLDGIANQMAHLFLNVGLEVNDHIALHMRNSVEHLTAILGCYKARLASVNINFRYTEHELQYVYQDSQAKIAVIDEDFCDSVAHILPNCPDVKAVMVRGTISSALAQAGEAAGVSIVEIAHALQDCSSERDFGPRSGDDHVLVYTGGTTGYPKGVVWRNADYYYAALSGGNPYGDPRHTPEEVAENAVNGEFFTVALSAPLMHGAGTFTLLTFLNLGGRLIMFPDFDVDTILRTVAREKPMSLVFVGDGMGVPLIDRMAELHEELDFSCLMAVASGGGIWSKSSRDKLRSILPNVIVRDNFGASESGNDGEMQMNDKGQVTLSAGPKIDLMDEDFNIIPPGTGQEGFIIRRGHIPLGYFGDDEKTARTFPVINGERISVLGDIGVKNEDGGITFLGRGSGCINTGGEKVFPEEVEQALKAVPAIADAFVAGADDSRFGSVVAAVVQFREGATEPSDEDIQQEVRKELAGYKVPRIIVRSPQLKRSPSGKADYRWAKEQIAAVSATSK